MGSLGIFFQEFCMLFEKIYQLMVFALIYERSYLYFYIFHCYWGVIEYKNSNLLY